MKKKVVIAAILIILVALVILFFPIKSTHQMSGQSEILSPKKEVIGNCDLKIEITEFSSLVFNYKNTFSLKLNGKPIEFKATSSDTESGDFRSITQSYYDEIRNWMDFCTLVYKKDFSYMVLSFEDNYYFLNNGSNVTYAQLPIP